SVTAAVRFWSRRWQARIEPARAEYSDRLLGCRVLQAREFLERVGIGECLGIIEYDLGAVMLCGKQPRLALALGDEFGQAAAQRGAHEAKDRLGPRSAVLQRVRGGHVGLDAGEALREPGDQIEGKVRRVARHRDQIRGTAIRKT